MKCPRNLALLVKNYLEDRSVVVHYAGKEHKKATEKGCVQGSIGGPLFWNLLLDTLLSELRGQNVHAQAFADDVVLVFSGSSAHEIQDTANRVLRLIHDWGVRNKLNFAANKTTGMVVTRKLKFETPVVSMNGTRINLVDEMKILGLTIDRKLTFNQHVATVCRKATNIYKQLAKTAKIEWGLNPEIIRTIYVAVIEPIVMYASSVWAPAVAKVSVQRQLNSLQRGFAQKICKAYRTVSLNAALVLAGLLPLDLRIKEAARLYGYKRGRPIEGRDGVQMEGRVGFALAPHPADEPNIMFESVRTDDIAELHLPDDQIFTDGSKMEGMVGAAYSHWRGGVEVGTKRMRLESHCTVFQAELFAILQAMELLLHGSIREAGILSDSRSSLDLICNPSAFHPLAFDIRQKIAKLRGTGREVRLYWVKAHVGIPGNERADELAKQAAANKKEAPQYSMCPAATLKGDIRCESVAKWGERYTQAITAGVTKLFLPDVTIAYKIVKKLGLTPILTQALTGHGGFAAYLYKYKCKDDPLCPCGMGAEESLQHLLLECARFDSERRDLEIVVGIKIDESNLAVIMADDDARPDLEEYINIIVKDAVKRNKTR